MYKHPTAQPELFSCRLLPRISKAESEGGREGGREGDGTTTSNTNGTF
uniref:Uncharacterized protein n=1 Tax=Anguilla anguilla TaxID=7936 RepID=A0A0E9VZ81_ANGAN